MQQKTSDSSVLTPNANSASSNRILSYRKCSQPGVPINKCSNSLPKSTHQYGIADGQDGIHMVSNQGKRCRKARSVHWQSRTANWRGRHCHVLAEMHHRSVLARHTDMTTCRPCSAAYSVVSGGRRHLCCWGDVPHIQPRAAPHGMVSPSKEKHAMRQPCAWLALSVCCCSLIAFCQSNSAPDRPC